MVLKNLNIYFFLILIIGVSVAGFLLIKPFIGAIFIAALFAVLFNRPYEYMRRMVKSPAIASALMLCVVVITIILPIVFVSGLVVNEVSQVVADVTEDDSRLRYSIDTTVQRIAHLPLLEKYVSTFSLENINEDQIIATLKRAAAVFQAAYHGFVNGVIGFFVMLFTLFYFFIDGKRFVRYAMQLSPLKDQHEEKLIGEFISMTRATLKGTVVIGCIQGTIGGIAFAIAGVISPIFWMVVMIVFSIIPAVGSGFVIFPTAIIMLFLGHVWQGVFLVVVGLVVTSIDNVLRPKLVGKDVQMHTLAVFFSTLGGLKLFGFIGFIVGPIIMALMLAMWKIYADEFKRDLDHFNA